MGVSRIRFFYTAHQLVIIFYAKTPYHTQCSAELVVELQKSGIQNGIRHIAEAVSLNGIKAKPVTGAVPKIFRSKHDIWWQQAQRIVVIGQVIGEKFSIIQAVLDLEHVPGLDRLLLAEKIQLVTQVAPAGIDIVIQVLENTAAALL